MTSTKVIVGEELQRRARTLTFVLGAAFFGLLGYIGIGLLVDWRIATRPPVLALLLPVVAGFLIVRRGYLQAAAWLLVGSIYAIVTWSCIVSAGLRAPAVFTLPLLIVLAAQILEWRQVLAVGALCTATATGIGVADIVGLLPPPSVEHPMAVITVAVGVQFGILALLAAFGRRVTAGSFERIDRSRLALRDSNLQLAGAAAFQGELARLSRLSVTDAALTATLRQAVELAATTLAIRELSILACIDGADAFRLVTSAEAAGDGDPPLVQTSEAERLADATTVAATLGAGVISEHLGLATTTRVCTAPITWGSTRHGMFVCPLAAHRRWTDDDTATLEAIAPIVASALERRASDRRRGQRREQLIQAQKLLSLGGLVSGFAHEVNNPNNVILLNAQLLERTVEDLLPIVDQLVREEGDIAIGGAPADEAKETLTVSTRHIIESARRIAETINSLRSFARAEAGEMAPVQLNDVVRDAIGMLQHRIRRATDNLRVDLPDDLPTIHGRTQQLQLVLINLLTNSLDSLGEREDAVKIATRISSDARQVFLTMEDEGCGVEEADLQRLMEPFFTTRRSEGAMGVGLYAVDEIVRAHGGTVSISSRVGEGTQVTLMLPASQKLGSAPPASA